MTPPVFELENIAFSYPGQPALANLSLSIQQGERIAILGANGSGKSTLLRLLDALYFPSSGILRAFGEPLNETAFAAEAHNHAFRRRVGLVFQDPDIQLFCPTVFDELAFGPLQLGWPHEEIKVRIKTTLEHFGIVHLKDRAPHRLSGGEKKRVALAATLILEPEVLLLDEPTSALDPESQSEVVRFLIESRHSARTIVTTTHDLDLVADIADRVFVLAHGTLAGVGTPAEILANVPLLRQTKLAHAHWHLHPDGQLHAHPHTHREAHEHHGPVPRWRRVGK